MLREPQCPGVPPSPVLSQDSTQVHNSAQTLQRAKLLLRGQPPMDHEARHHHTPAVSSGQTAWARRAISNLGSQVRLHVSGILGLPVCIWGVGSAHMSEDLGTPALSE